MADVEENKKATLPTVSQSPTNLDTVQMLVGQSITYMEQAMPGFIEDLQTVCGIESPSDHPSGLNLMAEQLATMLEKVGMQITLFPHPRGTAVLGTLTGQHSSGPTCLLLGHHDTVHPVGVAATHMRLEHDRFYGPGTVDMKAGLLQSIYSLEILHQQNYQDFHKILFLSVPDEEITSRYHRDLIREIAQGQHLVIGLEGASSVGTVVTRRKGCTHYRLTARGRAAHAGSSPERGRNAVLELAHQIVQTHSLAGICKGLTINAGPITGGTRANIVSDFAEILFDMRYLHLEDRHVAETQWRELLKHQLVPDVTLTLQAESDGMLPMVATEQSWQMAQQVQLIAEHILQASFQPETRGGASDCCNTAAEGCPTIDGLGAVGGGAHTLDEYILLPPVPRRIALLTGLMVSLLSWVK